MFPKMTLPGGTALLGLAIRCYYKNHANIYVLIYKENALQDCTERGGEID